MSATKPTEQGQDSAGQNKELDRRYGKIGISAVAAAVRCKGDKNDKSEKREKRAAPRDESFDSD